MPEHPYLNTWGKLNKGQRYAIVAWDLDRALARAGLNKAEATLMQAVRERSWGSKAVAKRRGERWPDAQPIALNLADLAREINPGRWENLRTELAKAKTRLITDRLLIGQEDALLINKQVHEWRRLSAEDIAYAADAQDREQSLTVGVSNHSRQACAIAHGDREQSLTVGVSNRSRPHYRNAPASEDLRRLLDCVREGEKDPHTLFDLSPEEEEEARRLEAEHHQNRSTGPHPHVDTAG